MERLFEGWRIILTGSGTEAIALALKHWRATDDREGRASAIVPAYGCPDLISACVYAGVRPVLVDVCREGWGYDKERLLAAVSRNTLAVFAVNFLGIGDEAIRLRQLLAGTGVRILQDCAQSVPADEGERRGDAIVLSFSRGKPVNLLGGGALLTREAIASGVIEGSESLPSRILRSQVGAAIFNAATHPLLYGICSRLPGLKVGKVRYRSLSGIRASSEETWAVLAPAVAAYLADPSPALKLWIGEADSWSDLGITPVAPLEGKRMLRLPLLASNRIHRDAVVARLSALGLGASAMYGNSLNRIPAVPPDVAIQGPFPAATELADRLFTLPTHAFVTRRHVEAARRCVQACALVGASGTDGVVE